MAGNGGFQQARNKQRVKKVFVEIFTVDDNGLVMAQTNESLMKNFEVRQVVCILEEIRDVMKEHLRNDRIAGCRADMPIP